MISRYERSKAERQRRAEDEEKRAEAERAVQESERRIISSQNKALVETAQKRKIRREQWRLVCAAAGLNGEASVTDVIKAYHALQELHASLKQKSMQNVVSENKNHGEVSSRVETNSPQADTSGYKSSAMVSHSCSDKEEKMGEIHGNKESSQVISGSSLASVHNTSNVLRHDEVSNTCQRGASVNIWQRHTAAQSSIADDSGSVLCFIDQNQFSEQFERLAELIKVKDTKTASPCQILTAESSPKNQWYNLHAAELLGEKDIMEKNTDIRKEVTTAYEESKPVLQRKDIKSRSAKLKAKLDKQRWMRQI